MKYHLDPFTPETWELFREAGATVIGEEGFCQNSGLSRHGGKLTQKLGPG